MNIVHVADFGVSNSVNGIANVVLALEKGQKDQGNNIWVILLQKNDIVNTKTNFLYLDSPLSFLKFVKEKKPDIIIFHSLYKIKFITYSLILLRFKIPYLIEFHGGSSVFNMRKNYKTKKLANLLFYNFFVNHSAGLIYLNSQELEDSIFKKNKVNKVIIPNGVYLPNKIMVSPQNEDRKKIEIIFLSRIDIHHKGLDLLIKAITILKDKGYSDLIHFSFYGNAKNSDDFIKLLMPCGDMVKYNGSVYGEKKNKVLENADIFILTSRYEGMPMAILEALAYSCPCIITQETNMTDIIIKHNAGWITTHNPEDIARTIEQAYKDYIDSPMKYKINSFNAVKCYNWPEIVKDSIDKYKKLTIKKNEKVLEDCI